MCFLGGWGAFFFFFTNIEILGLSYADGVQRGLQARSPARFCFFCFFYLLQYRIPDLLFCPARTAHRGGCRREPPLCAVRAGKRINQVFYIEEDKRKKQDNKKRTWLRARKPLCAPSQLTRKAS